MMNAVRTIRKNLKGEVPLIGFSGSPWTMAAYMVEGGSSKAFTKIKKMMYAEPATMHLLLDKVADSVILYLNAKLKQARKFRDDFRHLGRRADATRLPRILPGTTCIKSSMA